MKTFLLFFVSMMALRAAGPVAGAAPVILPATAVAVESNLYRNTDAQGKIWIYRRTPFGFTRAQAPSAASVRRDRWVNTKAWDDGDAVRFERPGPFGVCRWRIEKSDLDASERAFWERQQATPAGGKD